MLKQLSEEVLEPFSKGSILGELRLGVEDMEAQLQMARTRWIAFGEGYTLYSGLNRVILDEETGGG